MARRCAIVIDLNLTGGKESAGKHTAKDDRRMAARQSDLMAGRKTEVDPVCAQSPRKPEEKTDIGTQTDESTCNSELQGMYAKLLEKTETIVTLEAELTDIWRKWNDIQALNVKLQQENDSLKETFQRKTDLRDTDIANLTGKITDLEVSLSELTRFNTDLEMRSDRLTSELESQRLTAQACIAEKHTLKASLCDSQSVNERLSSQLCALQVELTDVRRESESRKLLREEMSSMIAEHDAVGKKLFDLQLSLEKRDAVIKELRLEMKRKEMEVKDLQTAKAALHLQVKLREGVSTAGLV